MALNTSSKICISKRLTITALLLAFVGFSVVVFSTLSSSINKTTSSKASGTESITLRDFGGKNMPCAYSLEKKDYYCNSDAPNLLCYGSLDFWLSNDTTKFNLWKENNGQGPKCVDPVDIPMGNLGQICKPAGLGVKQCDKGVCASMINLSVLRNTKAYYDYIEFTYKGSKRSDLVFTFNADQTINKEDSNGLNGLYNAMRHFTFLDDSNKARSSYIVDLPSICIPESLSKVESCGDKGEMPCINESGQHICFGEDTIVSQESWDSPICKKKNIITGKTLLRCDNRSESCDKYCKTQNAKCVDTCEAKVVIDEGGEVGLKERVVKAGLIYKTAIKEGTSSTGTCLQERISGRPIGDSCVSFAGIDCCCDKL